MAENQIPGQYDERHQQNLKRESQLGKAKQSRFSLFEIVITIIVVLLLVGIIFPLVSGYVQQSKDRINVSNAYNLYLATVATLTIETFPPEKLLEFYTAYKTYKPVQELFSSSNPIAQSITKRLGNSTDFTGSEADTNTSDIPMKGYIKIIVNPDNNGVTIYWSKTPDGAGEITYPN